MNPLLQQMNSPMNLALSMLQQRNPQAYQQFIQLKNSGQSPDAIINQLTSDMNEMQKQQIRSFGNALMK